jgi:hypothetical protein
MGPISRLCGFVPLWFMPCFSALGGGGLGADGEHPGVGAGDAAILGPHGAGEVLAGGVDLLAASICLASAIM